MRWMEAFVVCSAFAALGAAGCAESVTDSGSGASATSSGAGGSTSASTSDATTAASTTSSSDSSTASTSGAGGAGGQGGVAAGGAGGAGGQGGSPLTPEDVGCADMTREGFGSLNLFPYIAACGGAWDQPGIFNQPASCNHQAGNTGVNPAGTGCTVSDLCAPGWHVCFGKDDVVLKNPAGCAGVMDGAVSPVFFTSQMSSVGAFQCSTAQDATNDLFGCGDLGCDFTSNPTVQMMCAPLVMSSHDLCKGLRNDLGCGDWCNHLGKYPALSNAWSCGNDGANEALNVTKSAAGEQGGVLCCVDD